ncbi:MAG: hypothetical protein Q4C55_08160 [Eubacterium sp.]|nr:hypothetical protein [Eubacterium sp.]
MSYIYKICGKLSMVFYVFLLYQLWHLCKYGYLLGHLLKICIGVIFFGTTLTLWLISRKYYKSPASENPKSEQSLYLKIVTVLAVTFFFGAGIVYTAIPYNGALSWKVDALTRQRKVPLRNNNIYETGVAGILSDLDSKLGLPEELYLSNQCQISFDESGKIHDIYAFLYGDNEDGEKKTYLINYNAEDSASMTVWLDGHTTGEYETDMRLAPMLEILDKADWINQVKTWAETAPEPQVYELLYMGRRSFGSEEGLKYVLGNGPQTGGNGGEIVGFEVSLYVPEDDSITPVRYMMDPEYVSQETLKRENTEAQVEEAQNTELWTTDESDGTMYFFLDERSGWRLVIAGAAAGSRYYLMEKTADGGETWERLNGDPFGGEVGTAEGIVFFDARFGIIGLAGASQSHSALSVTRDGGVSFEKIAFPMDSVTALPAFAERYGFTLADYNYFCMPEKNGDTLRVRVTTEAHEDGGIVFNSTDNGVTWVYGGIIE